MNLEKKRILILLASLCTGFAILIGYLSYFQIFRAEDVRNNSYNKRLWINEDKILRGSITDRDGNLLAYSEASDGTARRIYKYDRLYSHVIGYSLKEYGKSGLEKSFNSYLVGANENTAINELINLINPTGVGNNLKLTIDHSLQAKARELLSGKKGSIIAMDPKTGEILAMVSLPDFNVNTLIQEWNTVSEDTNSPLFNRATQGLYPPGSVFKIVTAIGVMRASNPDDLYNCTGTVIIDGKEFSDSDKKGHGELGLNEAFAKSCNTYFAIKALEIGHSELLKIAEELGFNKKLDVGLESSSSVFPTDSKGDTDLAASGIGQGRILATPLNMLAIIAGIANDGAMMEPYLVSEMTSPEGKLINSHEQALTMQAGDIDEIARLKEMLREVVKTGTGRNASIKNVAVAGKTGTAENPTGKNHAWFAGFAPFDDPKVAVVVILEEEGSSGGSSAAPIARDIMIHALNNVDFNR
ncbi:peptidoglycan D,D-transpeptidase FtsI family protein [Gudongella oleilytica]|uniref:peptidoglycan D,D-transpeptidase FtsI family protein n=1 Tax=Gudongella oleilytica TaxID=1582259 RepID=UPI000FF89D43|nr:penicillin-binding transpeptidase domain-containing protein [Gudongella oleilytica]